MTRYHCPRNIVAITAEALQTAYGFTPADLQANQAGKLSAAQQATLGRGQRLAGVAFLVIAAIFIVIVAVIAIVVLPNSLSAPAGSSAVPPGIIVAVVAFVLLVIVLSTLRSRRKSKGLTGAVLSVEGAAKTKSGWFTDVNSDVSLNVYRVKVGGVTFAVTNQRQVDAFDEGSNYRVFYVKGTLPVIISAQSI